MATNLAKLGPENEHPIPQPFEPKPRTAEEVLRAIDAEFWRLKERVAILEANEQGYRSRIAALEGQLGLQVRGKHTIAQGVLGIVNERIVAVEQRIISLERNAR